MMRRIVSLSFLLMLGSSAHAVMYSFFDSRYHGEIEKYDKNKYRAFFGKLLESIRELNEKERKFIAIVHACGIDWYFNANMDALINDQMKRFKWEGGRYKGNCVKDAVVYIAGLPKVSLLKALYSRAQEAQGKGVLQNSPWKNNLSDGEAMEIVNLDYVGHINGIAMNICIGGDWFSTYMYNSFNGENAAEEVVNALCASMK